MKVPHLHPDTIDEVKQRADIYDVVSEYVVLKKQGKDFVGLCPFHDEKSPSFSVSTAKQLYYCFGCQAGGNAIKFLMEIRQQAFADVVLDLARRYQVPVKTLEPEQRQELERQLSLRDRLYEIVAIARSFFEHALRQPEGRAALDYLQAQRHLSEQTIQGFQLGYAPAGWESLYGYLVEQKGFSAQLVEKAGLIKQRKGGRSYYDRFRDRLMIPINDAQGRTIGFGGRTLGDEQPKYLNSPETELFDKGKTLFALDKAKGAIAKEDQAVVVEGYFDAIALHAAGITHTVASLGTALSANQVRQLLRYTDSKQVVLNFDADAAGTTAAQRAINSIADLAFKGQVQLRILHIPDGKDADEFLKTTNSAQPYRQLLAEAPFWLDWRIQQLLAGQNLQQPASYQQVALEMVKLLSPIVSRDLRMYYVNRCAELLSQGNSSLVALRAQDLLKQLNRPRRKGVHEGDRDSAKLPLNSDLSLLDIAESLLLRLYLHCPHYRELILTEMWERDLDFSLSHHRFLWQQIAAVESEVKNPADLLAKVQERFLQFNPEMPQLSELFLLNEKSERDLLNTPLMIKGAIACLERVMCEKRSQISLQLWRETDWENDPERAKYYQQQIYAEKARIQELDRERQVNLSDWLLMGYGE